MAEISVIIPIYNVEQYLDKCLETVCSQTFTDLEIILVDDGSLDSCPQKCDQWARKDSRIKVIHKKNGGLSSARNEGIKHATGKYLGFVDSDDWIMPQMYERLHKLIESGDYDIASIGFVRTDKVDYEPANGNTTVTEYTTKEFVKQLLKVGTQNSNQYAWNKLYLKEIIDDHIYPEGLTDEDVEGTLKAVLRSKKKIICSNEQMYVYRINASSITSKSYNSSKTDFLRICDHVVDLLRTANDNEMLYWAEMFRCRADFGVLSRIMIMKIDKEYEQEVSRLETELLKSLRLNYWRLMRFSWPISRKVVLTAFCINYGLLKRFYKRIKRL